MRPPNAWQSGLIALPALASAAVDDGTIAAGPRRLRPLHAHTAARPSKDAKRDKRFKAIVAAKGRTMPNDTIPRARVGDAPPGVTLTGCGLSGA